MKRSELRALLKIDRDDFESLWADFSLHSVDSEETIVRDFLVFLLERELLSEADYHKIKSDQHVDLQDSLVFESNGPMPGLNLQHLLGEGAMGEVFLARDITLQRNVALKRIKGEIDLDSQKLFVKEALITAQLEHPNIVPIYSAIRSSEEGIAYSMKMIRGKELTEIIKEGQESLNRGSLEDVIPVNERLGIFLKVCDAMSYSHARSVIHRDLKPDNIMLGPFGEVYVMDWGIAHVLGSPINEGDVVGTLGYMSPEQAKGETDILSAKSDQYSLGLILQELVTFRKGVPPGNPEDVFRRARRGQTAPVIHYSPKIEIRPELVAIIEKSTANDVSKRYPSLDAFAEDIRRFMREDPVTAWPDPLSAKIKRWLYRNQSKAIALIAMLVIVVLSSNLYHLHVQQQARQKQFDEEQIRKQMQTEKDNEAKARNQDYQRFLLMISTAVTDQSKKIEQTFSGYLNQLRILSTAGNMSLRVSAGRSEIYTNADFQDPERSPKDMRFAAAYSTANIKKQVSLNFPVFQLAPRVQKKDVEAQLYQLSRLQPIFNETMLRSAGVETLHLDKKSQDALILNDGVPIIWAFVATERGVHCAYPGKGGYGEDYDPRERPWYIQAKGQKEPICGEPYEDKMGQGLLIPCSQGIFDQNGVQVGVAGIEFSIKLIEKILQLPIFQTEEILLLDGDGRILVGTNKNIEKKQGKVFSQHKVVKDIRAKKSGSVIEWTAQGERVILYQRIDSLGWYYVVSGLSHHLIPQEKE